MRIDWVPYSASALVAGATALLAGALLMPASGEGGESLRIVQEEGGRWLTVAGLYFFAAVTLTLGLPAVLTLLDARSVRLGLTAAGLFVIGCIGTAGYAALLVMVRALVLLETIGERDLDRLAGDAGLGVFLYGWVAAFFLGELLLGIALLRSRDVPRWQPLLLLGHVASLPLSAILPPEVGPWTVVLAAIGLTGIGITANNQQLRV
ncbi:MAG: hypothetical protein ACRDO4_03665 [Nocardioides sp.]